MLKKAKQRIILFLTKYLKFSKRREKYTNSLAKLDFAINSVEKETNCIWSVSKKRLQEEDGIYLPTHPVNSFYSNEVSNEGFSFSYSCVNFVNVRFQISVLVLIDVGVNKRIK